MHRLWVRLSWCGCATGNVDMYSERSHNVHTNEAGRRLQTHNDNKTGLSSSFTPLNIQVLGFPGNLQWLAVCNVHYTLKLL